MDRRLIAAAAGIMGLATALSGCAAPGPARIGSEDGVVAATRDGRTRLERNARLSVRLPSNPSTGFAWVLKPFDETVLRPASPFNMVVAGAAPDGRVGAPGETVWVFEAGSPGAALLTFEYRQAWSNAPPADTATFAVTVD